MKSEGPELRFKLRGERTPEDDERMRIEAARAVASLIHFPAFDVAEAVGALAFDMTHARAQAVGAIGDSLSLARGALAHSFGSFAIAAETIRARGEEMRAALEAVSRLGSAGAFADGYGFAAARAVAGTAFSLPEPPPRLRARIHFERSCEDDAVPQTVDEPEGVM